MFDMDLLVVGRFSDTEVVSLQYRELVGARLCMYPDGYCVFSGHNLGDSMPLTVLNLACTMGGTHSSWSSPPVRKCGVCSWRVLLGLLTDAVQHVSASYTFNLTDALDGTFENPSSELLAEIVANRLLVVRRARNRQAGV